jgi:hypothetical protein
MLIFIGIGMCFIIYLLINKDRVSLQMKRDIPKQPEDFSNLPQIQKDTDPEPTQNISSEKTQDADIISKYLSPSPGSSEPLEYNSKGPEGVSEY